jgi:hypothetical protein
MGRVTYPVSVVSHAAFNVPNLIDLTPAPPPGVPIPYPNSNAYFESGPPSLLVINALFDHDTIGLSDVAPLSDLFIV